MPKRKAKYIVNTTQNKWNEYRGNTRKFHTNEDFVEFHNMSDGYRERVNPRVKTKHPHKSYSYPYYISDYEGKATAINWTFTNKNSADRAYKRKYKKQMNDEKFVADMKRRGYL